MRTPMPGGVGASADADRDEVVLPNIEEWNGDARKARGVGVLRKISAIRQTSLRVR
jgi:hypothetical protein